MKRLLMFILMSIIFITCNSIAAGIQKWVDEGGQIHYGDSPPARVSSEPIKVSRPPSDPGKPLPRFTPGEDAEEQVDEHPDQQAPVKETSEEQAREACEKAQKDLKILKRSTRIRLKQSDGSVHYMTREEIEQRLEQTEEDIKLFCN